jgi:menaquinone-dependent protoporphyrinogen oxidase
LQKEAVAIQFLGGEFLFERMNFFERAIIAKIAKTKLSVSQIDWEAVDGFVEKLK